MKPKLKQQDKKDENSKQQRWIGKIKENKEIFIVTGLVVLLSIMVWLSEIFDLPYYFFRAPPTPVNWREALVLSILTISIGTIAIIMLKNFINAREKSKEILQESEEKYRTLYENMPGVYYRADPEGNILMMNPIGVKLFGCKCLEDILGKNLAKDLYFNSEDRKKFLEDLKNSKGAVRDYEVILKKKDETPVVVSTSSHYYYDKQGNIAGVEGIFVDISERKQNEKIQRVLYNISKAANSPISLKQLYRSIHKELGTVIDTTNFYIALADEKEDKISFPYHQDEKDNNFPTLKISSINTLTTLVIRTAQSLLVNKRQIDDMIAQGKITRLGSVTDNSIWLGVPLKIEEKTIGAMVVQSYANPNLYSERDIKLMEFVSFQVATAIERKRTEERIKHLSFHDILTGLYNRAYFNEELKRLSAPRYYPLSLVIIDLNGLKVINDTFGHQEGDKLLQHFSQLLTSVSRKGDIIARIGGDEFAIILPSASSGQAHNFCQRIRKLCQQSSVEPAHLRPAISLGHATQEGEYRDIDFLFKEADRKMYQDKLFQTKS
jgi:diguanylate cyclase (GGDEF)-like protein/PAS domain S-box-containing protein